MGPRPAGAQGAAITDEDRRRGLRRMRTLALGLLVLAAVVFVATHGRGGGWGYLNAAAEASMVGAIADWFAVTALFRHPLGLPIPHTALIPTRKGALARSLQDFVTENFLAEPVVRARVSQARLSERVGGWLVVDENSRRVVDEAGTMLRAGLVHVEDSDVEALVRDELLPRLADEPVSDLAGGVLAQIVLDGTHHGLVDLLVGEVHAWLEANPETVARILTARAPWWTPRWLDDRVVTRVQQEAMDWVAEIRDDPKHPVRLALDDALGTLAYDLQHDEDLRARTEELKRRLLAQPQVLAATVSLWGSLRRVLVQAIDDPDSSLRVRAVEAVQRAGRSMVEDEQVRGRIDATIEDAVAYVVGRYGRELTTVITDTIDRWDAAEATRRIELHIGRDLQFIRINGTLVGGFAGLVIYTLSRLL